MAMNFTQFKVRVREIEDWLRRELTLLRTGRATTAILDEIKVESYGSYSPIAHVGNISMEDPRTLRIAPWDKSQIKAIEAAIQKADIGLSVVSDGEGLRVIFPELTSERRQQIVKILHGKVEEARISLRKEREQIISDMKRMERDGEMTEDEQFKAKEELQKIIDDSNRTFEDMSEKKETEITG
jgi:ribosome recycling factor